MQKKSLMLAVEGGGTKTRLLLADGEGQILARENGGPASGLYIDRTAYGRGIESLLKRLKRVADERSGKIDRAILGGPMEADLVESVVKRVFGPVTCQRAGEAEIALACCDLSYGVTLVAGTGSSCRARNEKGEMVSSGGLGPQFGDEGSGYWIAQNAIAAAMQAECGFGSSTALVRYACEFYGVKRVLDVLGKADKSGHVAAPTIAAFTPSVFLAAREGDAVARRICREAGVALGRLVVLTARRLQWNGARIPFVMTGGVFNGRKLVTLPLRVVVKKSRLPFDVYPEITEPTEGLVKILLTKRSSAKR